ncbi:cysteine/serine-rich nuclear protein 1 [Nematostella vectensis]|uniref:cysteine/serine-rich nuclear protein 1 n=1 Tax=Nematostella vectensis TaxID=45351 RepID=UPI00138FC36F|nr:cysteine/serine-rich nuclear protein 1 [Nematostella vectensis]
MLKRKSSTESEEDDLPYRKRLRERNVRFGEVTVFYFPRKQGFVSVPSSGGSTLGMARTHCFVETLKLCSTPDEDFLCERKVSTAIPVPQKRRKALLRTSGVKRIYKKEAQDCMELRLSRILCGCSCEDECYPETCECILNGIGCQVDYGNFPCSCSISNCQNSNGRKQYDPKIVQQHYCDTFTKLNGIAISVSVGVVSNAYL